MRTLLAFTTLMLLPLSALANDAPCKFTETRDLTLQLDGAKTVVFEVNQHDLHLLAGKGPAQLSGRACASNADWLRELTLTQQRSGDKLVVSLRREGKQSWSVGSDSYAWLDIRGSVPADVMVQLKVGSGDAHVDGARSLSVDVGSGDADVLRTQGAVHATVGSGDLMIDGAESVNLLSVGSGDAKVSHVRRDLQVGTIGSGDADLRDIGGNVRIDTIGSGDADVRVVGGNADIGVVGSGDVELRDITGNLKVGAHGSGDVRVNGVGGNLTVERSGSGSIRHDGVRGTVSLPRGK
ncbi:DUF2807 domain-containing protein [Stenotrophomonas sp. CFBP 13725]|uniref:GIN domain-containing protein n=1 Tax=Stenotrophomonas sp. CFBP 13725 TaxID=2775297 RepID=UPI0017803C7B|nr:DUF2807 domain-containing protein [Stenotrophomonas sp. CFBP 13725]MBD8634855.1 DUF2807 domain-containing protein [Stenotrophomonas sp. CFBP 13725]